MKLIGAGKKLLCQPPTGESFEQLSNNGDSQNNISLDDEQNANNKQLEKRESESTQDTAALQQSSSWLGSTSSGSTSEDQQPADDEEQASSTSTTEEEEDDRDLEENSSSGGGTPSKSPSSHQEPPVEVLSNGRNTSVMIDDDEVTFVQKEHRFCSPYGWATWTRRERILMAIIAFLSLLVLILFSTNMAMVGRNNGGGQGGTVSSATSLACGDTSQVDPDAPWGGWEDKEDPTVQSNTDVDADADATEDSATATGDSSTTTTVDDSEGSSSTTTTTTDTNPGFVPGGDTPYPPDIYEDSQTAIGDPDSLCGCAVCTNEIWNNMAGEFTCGERISYLAGEMSDQYPSQVHACRQIAFEFPCACGSCDPGRCGLPTPEFFLPDNWQPFLGSGTPAPTPITAYTDPSMRQEDQPLYCFPDPNLRATYTMWDNMVVQIKEDTNVCGPGNNRFTQDTVIVDQIADRLTLQYKNGVASEVRILLPENQRPFTYGTYSFSVESVAVKNAAGQVLSDILPKELVLGLFTWDDTESYAIHENFNHEVDIEISRWNCETNSDLQFLVQPPGYPQMHRMFTGDHEDENAHYSQGGKVYSFDWNPAEIEWNTNAGTSVNNNFVLKTEEAVFRNVPDHVQCLEDIGGNMEVRLNLWNMLGNKSPQGLSSTDVVEVVFDNFSFTPSGLTHVEDGGICTKQCHCAAGVSRCMDNVCTPI